MKIITKLQVLAIEFVLLAIDFVPLANEFVLLAVEFIALAFEFVTLGHKQFVITTLLKDVSTLVWLQFLFV